MAASQRVAKSSGAPKRGANALTSVTTRFSSRTLKIMFFAVSRAATTSVVTTSDSLTQSLQQSRTHRRQRLAAQRRRRLFRLLRRAGRHFAILEVPVAQQQHVDQRKRRVDRFARVGKQPAGRVGRLRRPQQQRALHVDRWHAAHIAQVATLRLARLLALLLCLGATTPTLRDAPATAHAARPPSSRQPAESAALRPTTRVDRAFVSVRWRDRAECRASASRSASTLVGAWQIGGVGHWRIARDRASTGTVCASSDSATVAPPPLVLAGARGSGFASVGFASVVNFIDERLRSRCLRRDSSPSAADGTGARPPSAARTIRPAASMPTNTARVARCTVTVHDELSAAKCASCDITDTRPDDVSRFVITERCLFASPPRSSSLPTADAIACTSATAARPIVSPSLARCRSSASTTSDDTCLAAATLLQRRRHPVSRAT
jgi:hypothetical protein